ncbi:MAG: hypothetical protein K2G93_08070 [Rikenella sp.]|nr:hypothetical protein [Rikenella sp.]
MLCKPPLAATQKTVFNRALAEILFKQLSLFERFPTPAVARGIFSPTTLFTRAPAGLSRKTDVFLLNPAL